MFLIRRLFATLLFSFSLFSLELDAAVLDLNKSSKATALIFISARCPCSRGFEKELKQIATEYQAKGFQFVGIHSNKEEPQGEAQSHFAKAQFPFEILNDSSQELANQFGALQTPHFFILSSTSEILYAGGVSRRPLDQILDGKEIKPSRTKSIGCEILR